MSALEQIRQRPILIISILGVALLLFILTAVDRPGELFTDTHTVAKVDGQKIDYLEFQRRVEQQQEQLQQQGYADLDLAQVQQYVLQQMIAKALMDKEFQRLGLVVTDKELSEAITGKTPHPYVARMLQQMGVPSAQLLYDAAFNPTKMGIDPQQAQQLQTAWKSLEDDTEQMLLTSKFNNLFFGALTANKLDARAAYDDNAVTSTIAYARRELSSLPDKDFQPTDNALQDLYAQERNRYRIEEPQYAVDYITVDIRPSEADLAGGQKVVEDALMGLRMNPGTESLEGDSHFYVNRVSAPEAKLAPALRKSLDKIIADSVTMVQFVDNTYTLAKLLGRTTQVDSVLLDMVALSPELDNDSILGLLNSGKRPAELGKAVAQAQDSVWMSLLDPQVATMKDELAQAATGLYFKPQNNNGNTSLALRIRTRRAPVTVYDIAEITYEVEPSSATINKLNSDLRKFLAANTTSKQFADNAPASGYSALSAVVTPSSLSVNGLKESRNAAKWAIEAKEGEVSPIFSDDRDTRLMAVACKAVYDGSFLPASDPAVRSYLENKARNTLKADKLITDLKGKANTLADYATLMQGRVDTTAVTFGQNYVRNFPMNEPALAANVSVAKEGQLVGPVALNNSVVVFTVTSRETTQRPFDYANDAMVFNQRQGAYTFQQSLPAVLLGNKKIDNRIQNFYSDHR